MVCEGMRREKTVSVGLGRPEGTLSSLYDRVPLLMGKVNERK